MLHPRFFTTPNNLNLLPGQKFSILWYSQIGKWTLVRYRLTYQELSPNGAFEESECLYKGMELVECDRLRGGVLIGDGSNIDRNAKDPRKKIDRATGKHGLDQATAKRLRSSDRRVVFSA
ncbi:MAG: hypothetical protein KME11_05055 [Timaviella obliquedivisa GSE-PSE-MK23-08B]|jgi:hypothetical protein|nr:hypothetical protein [Timaviella obliquedivisa GSE-PSE-MK23-08B]